MHYDDWVIIINCISRVKWPWMSSKINGRISFYSQYHYQRIKATKIPLIAIQFKCQIFINIFFSMTSKRIKHKVCFKWAIKIMVVCQIAQRRFFLCSRGKPYEHKNLIKRQKNLITQRVLCRQPTSDIALNPHQDWLIFALGESLCLFCL